MRIGIGIGIDFSKKVRRVIVRDRFNRANDATTLGNAETGQTWTALAGTWGVLNNQAYSPGGGTNVRTVINSGRSDLISVGMTIGVVGVNSRLLFRVQDASNEWYFGAPGSANYSLNKRVAGSATQMASTTTPVTAGDVVRVSLSGATIRCYVNGVLLATVTDSYLQSQTMHGLYLSGSASATFDDFKVEGL